MRRARCRSPAAGPFGTTSGASDGAHRVGLRAFLALGDLELDPLAFFERLVAVGLDGAVVNEDVTAAIHGDEAVALLGVEPLDRALCHNHPRLLDPHPGPPPERPRCPFWNRADCARLYTRETGREGHFAASVAATPFVG